MGASVIDSLVLSLGLDLAALRQGVQQVDAYIGPALSTVSQLAGEIQDGLQGAGEAFDGVAAQAQAAGAAMHGAGQEGAQALKKAGKQADQVTTALNKADSSARRLGKNLGGKLKRFLAGIVAPVGGMLAAGALIKGYFSDLATLDDLSKKTSLSMTERAAKQKLLSQYTKQDLETYRKTQKALEAFGKALSQTAQPIMQLLLPALTYLAQGFAKLFKLIREHDKFVLLFLAGIAAIITKAMLPALARMAVAAWAALAPFLPFIAVVAALVLLIDDLWTYIEGGESALADFWGIFGTGEEISESLAEIWADLKAVGTALFNGLKSAAKAFFSYFGGALTPLVNIFKNAFKFLKALFTGNFSEAFGFLKDMLLSIGEFILNVFVGAFNLVYDFVVGIFRGIGNFFSGIFDAIVDGILSVIKGILSYIPEFLLPDSLVEWINETDDAVAEAGANMGEIAASAGGAAGESVAPAVAGSGNVTDNSETTNNVTVIAKSDDPKGVAQETGAELRRIAAAGNKGVKT